MRMLINSLLAVSLSMGLAGNALAERAFYICDVVKIGPNADGNTYIQVSCPSTGTKTWHIINSTVGNKALAVVLTAMSLGSQVQVNIDPAVPYSQMTALYLTTQ